jgi:acetyl-CoA C-acetyltransferase
MENVVIVSGIRTPIGAYGGAFRDVPVYRLGSTVFNEAVKRAGFDPLRVDDVIMGQSYQNGECANGGRMALLEADWPDTVPGVTRDRRCDPDAGSRYGKQRRY